jgi:hypothetical protein
MDTEFFLTFGTAGEVLSPYIGKPDIYAEKLSQVGSQFQYLLVIFLIFQYSDKNLLPTYGILSFMLIDIQLTNS